MSYAIKSALVAIPAVITLLVGIAFLVLCFLLVVELVRTMPYLKQALQLYIKDNTPPDPEPSPSTNDDSSQHHIAEPQGGDTP